MLSIRNKVALSAGLLLVAPTGIVASAQSALPATSQPAPTARLLAPKPISIIPGAIAPGATVQKAQAAKWAVSVKYGARKAGSVTKLQKKSGSTWKTLRKGKVNKKGYALFAVPPAFRSRPVTYRIDGPGAPSASGSTSQWGSSEDFVDQFSGTSLNRTIWSDRQTDYFPESLRSCAKASPKAVKVAQGAARLSMIVDKSRTDLCRPRKPNSTEIFGKFRYRLQANIGTQGKRSMLYGVAAARIKFNPDQGQHASFWMQPSDPAFDTTKGQEIDIIEWFGKGLPNGGLTSFVYAPSRNGTKYGIGKRGWIVNPRQYLTSRRDGWYKRYHVFTVHWSPGAYVFRIDGQVTGRIPASRLGSAGGKTASTPESPILSILASDYELSKLPAGGLPQHMYVDWVKTWQDPSHIGP